MCIFDSVGMGGPAGKYMNKCGTYHQNHEVIVIIKKETLYLLRLQSPDNKKD